VFTVKVKVLRDKKQREEDRLMLKDGKMYVPKNEELRVKVIVKGIPLEVTSNKI